MQKQNPTWADHYQLTFWLWACLRDARAYLDASKAHWMPFETLLSATLGKTADPRHALETSQREEELAKYHFVLSMGMLIRVLKRAQHLFPTIQPAYRKATHLLKEGKDLRDMIEHAQGADGYLSGGGKYPDKFVREDSPRAGMAADAISTIINEDGHWLGGRLCVEKVITEITVIAEAAQKISPPTGDA